MIQNTKKILFLLETIRKNTNGFNSEINKLYSNTIIKNHRVEELLYNINEKYFFYKGIGSSLSDYGKKLLRDLEQKPDEALATIKKIEQQNETIKHQAEVSENLLRTPQPNLESISVIRKSRVEEYDAALKQIAATCVYLLVLYGGIKETRNLTWSDNDGIQEHIYSINTKFLPAIENLTLPRYSWIIEKRRIGGKSLIGDACFVLQYKPSDEVNKKCSALIKEPIGTHAFLNITAYETNEMNIPYCWGTGNIISVSPQNGLDILFHGLVEKPRSPFQNEYAQRIPAPLPLLKLLYNGKNYCASPETLVSILNQWESGYCVTKRIQNRRCVFCGRYLNTKSFICNNHFTSEL